MGPITGGCNAFSETYGYDIPGHTVSKSISIPYSGCSQVSMQGSWTYDSEGKLSTVTYPGAYYAIYGPTVTYTYDSMSRLLGASDVEGNATTGCGSTPPGGTVTWAQSAAYTPAGQLGALTRLYGGSANCSGISSSSFGEVWYFNNLSQTTEIDVSGIPGFPQPYLARYYYNSTQDNGQITSMDDGRLNYNIAYQYDALKRLATAAAAGHWTQSYSYDGFGNLTAKSVPSGSAEPSFPGVNSAKNWLTGDTYDANGNTTTGIGNQTLSYDIENRMIQSTVGSASTTYGYDESNHRILKTMGSNNPIVYFYGADGKLLARFAATSLGLQLPNYRIYFGGMLLGTTSGSAPSEGSALADRLGTYNPGYPYGTDAMSGASDDAPDFATYTKDGASGFEYANQRYYSAGYGRFTSPDPYQGSANATTPGSWNRYSYVNGDPVNRQDPTGLCDSVFAGIAQNATNSKDFQHFADNDGAISIYSYSNHSNTNSLLGTLGSVLSGIAQVAAQTFGATSNTYAGVLGLELASQGGGTVNVTAYSGGAATFTAAVKFLLSQGAAGQAVVGQIGQITYVAPGNVGALYGNGNVSLINGGLVNTLVGATAVPPPNPTLYKDKDHCGHNFACLAAEFPRAFAEGDPCADPVIVNQDMSLFPRYLDQFYWLNMAWDQMSRSNQDPEEEPSLSRAD